MAGGGGASDGKVSTKDKVCARSQQQGDGGLEQRDGFRNER